jgi:hypothetical protein
MLVIRNSQMMKMRISLLEDRVKELILDGAGSTQAVTLTAPSVRQTAARFGITSLPDLREFVALVTEVGLGFEADPAQKWIAHILNDPDVTSPSTRLARVHDLRKRREAIASRNDKAEQLFAAGPAKATGARS